MTASTLPPDLERSEWLETDGLGGFASGTVSGIRTRRYHALLLGATTPPTGRVTLVNGVEAWLQTPHGRFGLSSQRYDPDVVHPDGHTRISSFTRKPWPKWLFDVDGLQIEQQIFVTHDSPVVVLSWRILGAAAGVQLEVRPLFSGRDYHSMHHENGKLRFEPRNDGSQLRWALYDGVPDIVARSNGRYAHEPTWYRNFSYSRERSRGLDHVEDLASPGSFSWDLSAGEALLLLGMDATRIPSTPTGGDAMAAQHRRPTFVLPEDPDTEALVAHLRLAERERRARFASPLHTAADQYLVRRGTGRSIVAGYPWFTDWGRDTFIALRGLCLAAGRLDEAQDILLEWSSTVSQGMLPNRFPDAGEQPEYNSVDASLWYVVTVYELEQAFLDAGRDLPADSSRKLRDAVGAILDGYSRGTRFGIRADGDGLLAAGEPGWQLTWMDAKVGDVVITPRIGKPVEIQALWLNALWIGAQFERSGDQRWKKAFETGLASFRHTFWNVEAGCLYDVVDVDLVPGRVDPTLRPNQIFAVGGLPLNLLEADKARRVVDRVEEGLWTPLGLRSLAPGEPGYCARYEGDVWSRDSAYHQGTVWPWLAGAFVEAWLRVHRTADKSVREARSRFLEPLLRHLEEDGLGHVSEIADAEPPHLGRGCPFQAWSLGEVLRLQEKVFTNGHRTRVSETVRV